MRKQMKFLCMLAMMVSLCSIPLTGWAAESDGTNRYIITETLPEDIEEYAQSTFQSLNNNDLKLLDLDVSPEKVKLSYGFKVDLIASQDYNKYYFPILENSQVIATLIVNDIDGEMTYTLLRDDVTHSINNLHASQENPVKIVVSDTAVYAVDNATVSGLGEDFYATEASRQSDLEKIQVSAISNAEVNIISVDDDHTYDISIGGDNARAITGRSCDNFPYVNNKSVNGVGTCWASSTAAMIEYIKNGSSSTDSGASTIRDELLKKQTEGGIDDAKTYISDYTGRSLTKTSSSLSWTTVKEQILSKDNPCYMRLHNSATGGYHATALIGYDYESSNDSNHRMYIMDPNVSSRVITSFGSTYATSYGYTYSWIASLKK